MSVIDDLMASPVALNRLNTTVAAAGDLIGAMSHFQFGQTAQQAAEFQAAQMRQQAGQTQASAQRQAFDVDRQAQYIASAALASAAASGGGASDPTVTNLIARNASEMAYRKATALYQGDERARMLNLEADAKEYTGAETKANSAMVGGAQVFKAGTSILRGAAREGLLKKYGGNGPPGSGGDW